MASTYSLTSDSYQGRYLYLSCSQSKDIATNKSTISWTLTSTGGTSNYYSTGPTTVTINGVQVYYKAKVEWDSKTFPAAKGSVSGTLVVDHDTYGKKSISVSLSTAIYYGTVGTKSGTWELDNIPRQATLQSAPNFTDLDNPTITYSNPAGSAVSQLMTCIAIGWQELIPYKNLEKGGSSYTYEFTPEERKILRNATKSNTLKVNFFVTTVISGTYYYSYEERTLTISETEDTKPSVEMAYTLNNGSLDSKFDGLCIQGKSRLDVSFSASGKYGADIISSYVTVDGKTYTTSPFTTDVITTSGMVDVLGYAKDTRSFAREVIEPISVTPYSKPLLAPIGSDTAISCYRSDANGNRVGKSRSVWLKTEMSYSSIEGNSCALQWRMKEATASWSGDQWTDLTTTDNAYNALLGGDAFDEKTVYTVQIRAIDTIGEYDLKTFEIPTEDVALHLGAGGRKVAVGTYCTEAQENDTFYSDWVGIFDKGLRGTSHNFNVTDVLAFPATKDCIDGITPIIINDSTNKDNLPEGNYAYSVGIIHKRADDQYNVVLMDYMTGKIAINVHLSGTWTGWKYITPQ